MPTKRVKTGVRNLTTLTHAQKSFLLSGRYLIVGDAQFESEAEIDEAWSLHREKILEEWDRPGRRPPLFWDLDVDLPCLRWPDQWVWPKPFECEAETVRGLILAGKIAPCRWDGNNRITSSEVATIEEIWRDTLRVALAKGHSTAADVPRWFRDEYTPALRVEIAADRSAWKRSMASPSKTSASADEAASRS